MNSFFNLAENPLFVKHVRSRLRRGQLLPSIVVVLFLSICIVWLDSLSGGPNAPNLGVGSNAFFWLQGVILVLMGGSQVSAAVAHIKDSGILDFHRITPVPARVQAVGFLLGAPIREYILFAVTLPFALYCALTGPFGLVGFGKLVIVLLTTALLYHGLALVTGLSAKTTKGASGRFVGLIAGLNIIASPLTLQGIYGPTLLTAMPVYWEVNAEVQQKIQANQPRGPFQPQQRGNPFAQLVKPPALFGVEMPLVLQTLLFQSAILVFLFIAAARRFHSNRLPVYSKPQALAFLVTLAAMCLGSLWETSAPTLILATTYFLTFCALGLSSAVTPQSGDVMKGLQRARRHGASALPPWSDLATNKVAVTVFAAVLAGAVLLAITLAPQPVPQVMAGLNRGFVPWAPLAVAVLTVFGFGFLQQAFQLRYGKRGPMFFGLFLFLFWVAPLAVGGLATASGTKEAVYLFAVSPIVGIAASSLADMPGVDPNLIWAVTLVPTGLVALLAASLLLREERRASESVRKERDAHEAVPIQAVLDE